MDTDQDKRDKDRYEVEREWAERLGINFEEPKEAPEEAGQPEPETPGSEYAPSGAASEEAPLGGGDPLGGVPPQRPTPPPIYTMPPGMQLPPMHPNGPMPPTYMVWAIISTICCCLPAGVIAIYFSSMVSSRYYARNYEGARKASEMAEIWIIVSIVVGVIVNALYFPLSLAMQL